MGIREMGTLEVEYLFQHLASLRKLLFLVGHLMEAHPQEEVEEVGLQRLGKEEMEGLVAQVQPLELGMEAVVEGGHGYLGVDKTEIGELME